jgi:Tol biopolymer transport system component
MGGADSNPEISADGLTLFFDSNRPGSVGDRDIWMVSRQSISDPWDSPINLGAPVNSSGYDARPTVTADGLTLVFDRNHARTEEYLYMATRANQEDAFGVPQSLGIIGASPSISADGLTLFFMRFSSNPTDFDIYVATRATREDPFGTPEPLGPEINSELGEADPDISFDGSTLHFVRTDAIPNASFPGYSVNPFLRHAEVWEALLAAAQRYPPPSRCRPRSPSETRCMLQSCFF